MFTQGKWEVQQLEETHHDYNDWETFAIRSTESNVCLAVVGEVDRHCAKQNKANAYLMAAAPDLLAACEAVLDSEINPIKHYPKYITEDVFEMIERAIAKAQS